MTPTIIAQCELIREAGTVVCNGLCHVFVVNPDMRSGRHPGQWWGKMALDGPAADPIMDALMDGTALTLRLAKHVEGAVRIIKIDHDYPEAFVHFRGIGDAPTTALMEDAFRKMDAAFGSRTRGSLRIMSAGS